MKPAEEDLEGGGSGLQLTEPLLGSPADVHGDEGEEPSAAAAASCIRLPSFGWDPSGGARGGMGTRSLTWAPRLANWRHQLRDSSALSSSPHHAPPPADTTVCGSATGGTVRLGQGEGLPQQQQPWDGEEDGSEPLPRDQQSRQGGSLWRWVRGAQRATTRLAGARARFLRAPAPTGLQEELPRRRSTGDKGLELLPEHSPHSATLALLHKKGFHNYGRGPITASVFRHNIAGDLILPSMPRKHGPTGRPEQDEDSLLSGEQTASRGAQGPPGEALPGGGIGGLRGQHDLLVDLSLSAQSVRPAGSPSGQCGRFCGCTQLSAGPVAFLVLTPLGVWLLVEHRYMEGLTGIQLWRWVLWIAASIGMSYVTSALLSVLAVVVEHRFGLHKRVVFLTVSLKPPALSFLQAVQTAGLLVAFCSKHSSRAACLYSAILSVTQCVSIWTGVQLLKTALARGASSYFYKSRYYEEIHGALMKEQYLQHLARAKPSLPPAAMTAATALPPSPTVEERSRRSASRGRRSRPSSPSAAAGGGCTGGRGGALGPGFPISPLAASTISRGGSPRSGKAGEGGGCLNNTGLPGSTGRKSMDSAAHFLESPRGLGEPIVHDVSFRSRSVSYAGSPKQAWQPSASRAKGDSPVRARISRLSAASPPAPPSPKSLAGRPAAATDGTGQLPWGQERDSRSPFATAQSSIPAVKLASPKGSAAGSPKAAGNTGVGGAAATILPAGSPTSVAARGNSNKNVSRLWQRAVRTTKRKLTLQEVEDSVVKKSVNMAISDKVYSAFTAGADKQSEAATDMEARQLALYIFWNVKPVFDATFITQADVERVLLSPRRAQRCMAFLDIDQDGRVTLQEMCAAVLKVFKDRRSLAKRLKDQDSIAGQLEAFLSVLLHSVSVLLYLHIFNVDISSMWFTFSSVLLAASFIFGNSVKTVYEAAIFLFVVHPFDVGDCIELAGEQQYTVVAINLMVVTLLHSNGSRVYHPINQLAAQPLTNVSRSANKTENLRMTVDTRGDKGAAVVVECISACMAEHIAANPGDLTPTFQVTAEPTSDPMKFNLVLRYTFNGKGENTPWLERVRSGIVSAIGPRLRQIGARYSLPPQVIHASHEAGQPDALTAAVGAWAPMDHPLT
mmetsp:Transcript_24642/g.68574  ORF Transcript_24642/g.68574 Transcript_24642/m.68574 type:complete len:1128 (+) Transcript_24642:278-3661(+)